MAGADPRLCHLGAGSWHCPSPCGTRLCRALALSHPSGARLYHRGTVGSEGQSLRTCKPGAGSVPLLGVA